MKASLSKLAYPSESKLSEEQRLAIRDEANAMTTHAFRNSPIESLHAGIVPYTETGDYTDVRVVTPKGEIPWNELSRINNNEMKELMIRASESLAGLLLLKAEAPDAFDMVAAVHRMAYARNWDRTLPEPPAELVQWAASLAVEIQESHDGSDRT